MPTAHEFLQGIRHYGDKEKDKDKLWPVYRAAHSSKMKHLSHFNANLDGKGDSASGEWLFDLLWPDTSPGAPGDQPLSPQALRRLMDQSMSLKSKADLCKAILNLHDGEAKVAFDSGYVPFPDDVDIHEPCFWQYQYAKTREVRDWQYRRRSDELVLSGEDILWMLKKEQNETTILRWVPRTPASGGDRLEDGDWEIRTGKYVTLAELFFFGAKEVTAFHLYNMYLNLDHYIHNRKRSSGDRKGR